MVIWQRAGRTELTNGLMRNTTDRGNWGGKVEKRENRRKRDGRENREREEMGGGKGGR